MVQPISPFLNIRTQKIFSIIVVLIGLLFMFFSAPFIIELGTIAIASTAIGAILFLIGLIYFLGATIQ